MAQFRKIGITEEQQLLFTSLGGIFRADREAETVADVGVERPRRFYPTKFRSDFLCWTRAIEFFDKFEGECTLPVLIPKGLKTGRVMLGVPEKISMDGPPSP